MKKKASINEPAPSEQEEKTPAETTAGETGVTGYYGIDSDMAPPKETESADAADERLSRIFQGAQARTAAIAEPPATANPAAVPEPAAVSTSYMTGNADSISAEAIPARPADQAATPSGQETGTLVFPSGSLETEEDLMKELNSIVKPGEGVVKAEEEEKAEKGKG